LAWETCKSNSLKGNNMDKYILIHYFVTDGGGSDVEIEYYNTIEEAQKYAMQGDTITQVIEEK
jgi:hypothetical protein